MEGTDVPATSYIVRLRAEQVEQVEGSQPASENGTQTEAPGVTELSAVIESTASDVVANEPGKTQS